MAERYYITGVQLGMLKAFNEFHAITGGLKCQELLQSIEDNQFLGRIERDSQKVVIVDYRLPDQITFSDEEDNTHGK